MKRVHGLSSPTPGLAAYLKQGGDPGDWDRFRRNDREAYRELRDTLARLQHGICGYCEIGFRSEGGVDDWQVEHIIPQSDPEQGGAQALNHRNLLASCRGGSARNLFGPEAQHDPARYLPDSRGNVSCGQAKGDSYDPDFVDPRETPALPSLMRVLATGIMVADDDACAAAGVAANRVQRTIAILGLNVERLRREREKRWSHLHELYDNYRDNPDVMDWAVQEELLPDKSGNLTGFFTTARAYFGPLAELVLAETSQAWI